MNESKAWPRWACRLPIPPHCFCATGGLGTPPVAFFCFMCRDRQDLKPQCSGLMTDGVFLQLGIVPAP